MKHFGDITQLSGYDLPIVDVIVGGSPCQDLSVAGKRAGLKHSELGDEETTRSGLFMEQMRIVKEMREADVRRNGRSGFLVRPRFMVWENVPGAFSSGTPKGADFAAVIEEIIKVCEPNADLHVDVPSGGWTKSGCFYSGDGSWSIAWRVHDAQFWGVPQRRKRISLVADFGGLSAPEVLFVRKGMSRDPEQSEEEGQRTPQGTERGSGESDPLCFTNRGWQPPSRITDTLRADCHGAQPNVHQAYGIDQQGGKGGANYSENISPPILSDSHGTPHGVAYGISSYDSNAMKSPNPHSGIYKAESSRTLDLTGGSPACNQGGVAVVQAVDVYNQSVDGEVSASLTAAVGGTNTSGPKVLAVDCRNGVENSETNGTLQTKPNGGTSLNLNNVIRERC